jgi:hypothetical protein
MTRAWLLAYSLKNKTACINISLDDMLEVEKNSFSITKND